MHSRVLEKVRPLPANVSVMLSITSCRGIVCLALNGILVRSKACSLTKSAIVLASIAAISSLCATHARAGGPTAP